MAPLAVARPRARPPALRWTAPDPAGRRPRRRPVRRRRPCSSPWLTRGARAGGSRGGRAPRGRDAHEARGPALRRVVAAVALVASRGRGGRVAGLGARAASWLAAAVPWRLWYRSHDIERRGPADGGGGGLVDRAVDSLRLSFDVLFDTGSGRSLPVVATRRARRRRSSGATAVLAAYVAALLGIVFFGGAWVDVLVRRISDHGGRVREPDRAVHGSDRLLAAVPCRSCSARSGAAVGGAP